MLYVDTEFGKWLLNELDKRGWSQNELGRRAGLTSGTISNVINGVRTPATDTLKAIASALKLPKETVFREAGILSSVPEQTMICGLPTPKPRPWTIGFSSNVNVLLNMPISLDFSKAIC